MNLTNPPFVVDQKEQIMSDSNRPIKLIWVKLILNQSIFVDLFSLTL